MKDAYNKAIAEYLPKDDVNSVMIGLKFKDGKWTDEQCGSRSGEGNSEGPETSA